MINVLFNNTEVQGLDGNLYQVQVGTKPDGEAYCNISLLPMEGLLFSASLEWLESTGELEDGDATHEVDQATIDQLISVAIQNGYKWEPFEC